MFPAAHLAARGWLISAFLEDERDQKNDQDDEKNGAESDVHMRSSLLSLPES